MSYQDIEQIDTIYVHNSASPNFKDFRADDIHKWHLRRGFDGNGYHDIVCVDGLVEQGRPKYWVGAHVADHNQNTLGICVIGTDQFTDWQCHTLRNLLRQYKQRWPNVKIKGHCEADPINKPHCPGEQLMQIVKEFQ